VQGGVVRIVVCLRREVHRHLVVRWHGQLLGRRVSHRPRLLVAAADLPQLL